MTTCKGVKVTLVLGEGTTCHPDAGEISSLGSSLSIPRDFRRDWVVMLPLRMSLWHSTCLPKPDLFRMRVGTRWKPTDRTISTVEIQHFRSHGTKWK